MGKVAFEDQNPGEVKYGSFSVDEIEALGFGSLHGNVETLQALRKAQKELRLYAQMLNIWAAEILHHRTHHTEYELRMVPMLRIAADYLRVLDHLGYITDITGEPPLKAVIERLKEYLSFLMEHEDIAKPEQIDRTTMVIRLLQSQ